MSPPAVLAFLCSFAIYVIAVGCYRVWVHPLANCPGPKLWALSRLPWLWHVVRGDLWRSLARLHAEFGDTIRIAPNEITTLSTAAWSDIYTARPLLLKDPCSQTPPLNGAHSLFTAEGETHKRIRGILAFGFSDKALREQATLIEHHTSRFIARIRREKGASLDINQLYGYLAFDTITDLTYGESSHGLDTNGDHPWIKQFFLHAQYSTIRNSLRWFTPLDKILDFFFLRVTRKTREINWMNATTKIDRRLSHGDTCHGRPDLLTPVVGRIVEGNGLVKKGITKEEVLSHVLALLIADCQLTTAALTSCTYFLLQDSRIWDELSGEIRGCFKCENGITVQSTQGLAYLEAVLNETLRLHHPSPISLPRVVPPGESRIIAGHHVPGSSIVGISLQNILHCPNYWYEPLVFHPERFLPQDDPRYKKIFDNDVRSAFMPFSTGPRNCIGAKLFFAQARQALAKLVWNFDIQPVDTYTEDWLNHRVFIVLEPKPLYVKLVARCL